MCRGTFKHVALVSLAVFAVTLSLFLSSNTHAHDGAVGVVKERMDKFKASERATKTIKQAISRGDTAKILTEAKSLVSWSREMEAYFPKNANQAPSEARDEIWLMWDDFLSTIQSFDNAAQALIDAAASEDTAAVHEAFEGLSKSCKSCHKEFRLD